jgi:hypothetical protein
MTEAQWRTGTDLKKMLKYLRRRASERKRRLFAVACCRRVLHLIPIQLYLIPDQQAAEALTTVERYADGLVGSTELIRAEEHAYEIFSQAKDAGSESSRLVADALYGATCGDVGWDIAEYAATNAAAGVGATAPRAQRKADQTKETATQLGTLREIFGNPFRPITVDPGWLTSDVLALARGIYEERAFDRMPILADALQEAGCDSDDILNHLRDPNATHVRGCWAIDLVLGKE